MSVVFPKFRHELLKELKRRLRFSDAQKRSRSLPGTPFPTPCPFLSVGVPFTCPRGPLSRVSAFRSPVGVGLAACPGLSQVPLPEFLRAPRRGRRALLQRIGDAPVPEAISPAARTGNPRGPPSLAVGHQVLASALPASSGPSAVIRPSDSGGSRSERAAELSLRVCGACVVCRHSSLCPGHGREEMAAPCPRALLFLVVGRRGTQRTVGKDGAVGGVAGKGERECQGQSWGLLSLKGGVGASRADV